MTACLDLGVGLVLYGVGTATEALTTMLGWNERIFRAWYISGALCGRAPLAPKVRHAAIFLIGGAAVSALRYRARPDKRHKFVGNVLIAVGALLPGIGGGALASVTLRYCTSRSSWGCS